MAIHIALAKGRIHKAVMNYLQESGYVFSTYSEDSRKLIFEDSRHLLKVTLVKSPDVAVYVERGAADVGIVGEDVLIEEAPGADVYEVMDLGIGRCRMAVAGIAGKPVDMTKRITIGTKYPRIARQYFELHRACADFRALRCHRRYCRNREYAESQRTGSTAVLHGFQCPHDLQSCFV